MKPPRIQSETLLPIVALGLLTAWGVLAWRPPLDPGRLLPSTPTTGLDSAGAISARLWHDPLRVVAEARQQAASDPSRSVLRPVTILELQNELEDLDGKKALLPILLDSGPYGEDREDRLRTRYAAQAALARCGFLPHDQNHLRYMELCLGTSFCCDVTSNGGESACTRPLVVPFEIFSLDSREQRRIVPHESPYSVVAVLWLDETRLMPHVSAAKLPIFDALKAFGRGLLAPPQAGSGANVAETNEGGVNHKAGEEEKDVQLTFRIIGPTNSDHFRKLVEVKSLKDEEFKDVNDEYFSDAELTKNRKRDALAPHHTKFFSSWATAPGNEQADDVDTIALAKKLSVVRVTSTDDRLCSLLIAELERRRALRRWGQPRGRVLLIGEWETSYARAIRTMLRDEMHTRGYNTSVQLVEYSYLRGLDGELPAKPPVAGLGDGAKVSLERLLIPLESGEEAESRKQIDYIRRLADDLQRSSTPITAVGVVGSDVYDKLVVLRALRALFPEAVFFTTDLDARLYDAEQLPYTRNLIVAAHYGLTLDCGVEEQLFVPPFRDSYQTGVYAAVLRALDFNESTVKPEPRWRHAEPRLYELSRHGPVRLDAPAQNAGYRAAGPRALGRGDLLPLLLAMLLLSAFITYLRGDRRRDAEEPPKEVWDRLVITTAMTFVALAGLILLAWAVWYLLPLVSREPRGLLDGVSAWPSIGLRVIAVALTVVLTVWVFRCIRVLDEGLAGELRFTPPDPGSYTAWRSWEGMLLAWRMHPLFSGEWRREHGTIGWPPTRIGPVELWREYLQRSDLRYRTQRTLVFVAGAAALLLFLHMAFGLPRAPVRDWVSRVAHWSSYAAAIVTVSFLTFLIWDGARLGRQLICALHTRADAGPRDRAYPAQSRDAIRLPGEPDAMIDLRLDLIVTTSVAAAINQLLVLPFIVLVLLAGATLRIFDAWTFSWISFVVFGISAVVATLASVSLSRAARESRDAKLDQLRQHAATAQIDEGEGQSRAALAAEQSVKAAVQRLQRPEQLRHFAPMYRWPVVTALILPLVAMIALVLMERSLLTP